jgi:hypothetical protein
MSAFFFHAGVAIVAFIMFLAGTSAALLLFSTMRYMCGGKDGA